MRWACSAEDYENDRVLIKDLYTGMIEVTCQPGADRLVPRQRRNWN